MSVPTYLKPDRDQFASDPFGYAALAGHRWAFAQELAGATGSDSDPQSSRALKSPVLWLSQAHALSEAARVVLVSDPNLDPLPVLAKGLCDGQYRAVGLMLTGYSLEVCLKAMLIIKLGVSEYEAQEKKLRHHDLVKLTKFVPDLSQKDLATLTVLTHFVEWAGRCPDPGAGRESKVESVFALSEKHRIAAKDVFGLAIRVMKHASVVVEQSASDLGAS